MLVENVAKYVHRARIASLLDVGAGHEITAVPLSRTVSRYLAIEHNEQSASELRRLGLKVMTSTFPVPLNETFDMVLSSHSVPELRLDLYEAFLNGAWNALNPLGTLLIVTFKGCRGDIAALREEITGEAVCRDPQRETIINILSKWGNVRIERVNSYLQSLDPRDIVFYLRSLLRSEIEREQYSTRLLEILEMRYKFDSRYIFPTEHAFMSIIKR